MCDYILESPVLHIDCLETDLSPDSSVITMISQTLTSTSTEIRDLQKIYNRNKTETKKYKKRNKFTVPVPENRELRGSRIIKMCILCSILMMFVLLLSWLSQPKCCDRYNVMSFLPQLRYINGPPPI